MKTKQRRIRRKEKGSSPFFSNKEDGGFFMAQPKLTVGQPGDRYEQEADHIADKVVAGSKRIQSKADSGNFIQEQLQGEPLAEQISPLLQRQEELEEDVIQSQPLEEEEEMLQAQAEEEEEEMLQAQPVEEEEEVLQAQSIEEEEEMVQTKGSGSSRAIPNIESTLRANEGGGSKLDSVTKSEMEQSFGADFSKVNVHTDSTAVQISKQLGAQAFTHGNDIYFNKGKYNPESTDGKHLLAHELTHTIQQTGQVSLNLQMTIGDNHDLSSARFSGNLVLEACFDGEQTLQNGSSGAPVSIMQQALVDVGFQLPVFGVDGIFGNETRTAIQNFQRASSIPDTGVLDVATMSSLDALYSGGTPVLPPAVPVNPPPGTVPVVTSETIASAPDGTADTRTTVGVGERVRFTGDTAGTWTATTGRIIGNNNGVNMVWEAPPIAASPTISLTTTGGATSIHMTVTAPDSLTMTVGGRHAIPAGTAGACMQNNVFIHPMNVNFGRTQWLEVAGPASNVSGYFTRFTADQIFHHPNPNFLPFNDNNTGLTDHAAWHGVPAPFSGGRFDWVIPNLYKIDGEPDSQGKIFTNTTQAFFMTSTGTMMITKAGALVIRFINNTVI
ncbi:eCIS core domain-containing protein [Saccharicrinis sp. 156]|uniref:eCIS core domain-containing protein n=1 Tax=Saccharicrinis sp. 156 TaxID=3417574 RepID=UPI003D326416